MRSWRASSEFSSRFGVSPCLERLGLVWVTAPGYVEAISGDFPAERIDPLEKDCSGWVGFLLWNVANIFAKRSWCGGKLQTTPFVTTYAEHGEKNGDCKPAADLNIIPTLRTTRANGVCSRRGSAFPLWCTCSRKCHCLVSRRSISLTVRRHAVAAPANSCVMFCAHLDRGNYYGDP